MVYNLCYSKSVRLFSEKFLLRKLHTLFYKNGRFFGAELDKRHCEDIIG